MRKYRFQFTLRTVFIVSFIFAIVCALVKCEMDARRNFDSVGSFVAKSMIIVQREASEKLNDVWLVEAKANPTFSEAEPPIVDAPLSLESIGRKNFGYFSSKQSWSTRMWTIPATGDFTKKIRLRNDDINIVDLEVQWHRPCSIISRQTSISILLHTAPNNRMTLDLLKNELDKAGLKYDVKED